MAVHVHSASHADAETEERRYYEESARVYGSWFASTYEAITMPVRPLRTRVARWAAIRPGMRVIDVATGTGAQARAFAAAGATVVGVDLSERMLGIARAKTRDPHVTYVRGDATALAELDGSFDAACVSFALHEMPATIRERALAELVRVTRPGGTIVIVDYGRPRSWLARKLLVPAMALFERATYVEFVRGDVREVVERLGVLVRVDRRVLLGIGRVLVGARPALAS